MHNDVKSIHSASISIHSSTKQRKIDTFFIYLDKVCKFLSKILHNDCQTQGSITLQDRHCLLLCHSPIVLQKPSNFSSVYLHLPVKIFECFFCRSCPSLSTYLASGPYCVKIHINIPCFKLLRFPYALLCFMARVPQ